MSRIEAYRHLYEDRPNVSCGSVVVHALSPQRALDVHANALVNGATRSLAEIAACVSLEHARVGNCVWAQSMPPDLTPSDFFRQTIHQVSQLGENTFFVGGLMLTQELDERHVVAVLNHHKGRQHMFSVCDTSRIRNKPLMRRMTYREMDQRITPATTSPEYRAMVLLGRPLQSIKDSMQNSSEYEVIMGKIEREREAAKRIVQTCLYRSGFEYLLHED